jgi:membrane protease YdiL (CAAX protease family)
VHGTVEKHGGRLLAWLVFVVALALLAYGARVGGPTLDDLAYRYSSSVAALVQYGLMLGILLLIARAPTAELFALRRPSSWGRAVGLAVLALLTIYAAAFVYEQALSLFGNWSPTDEQGSCRAAGTQSRAGAFVAFFLVVTFVAPAVEELTYRGLGISLLAPWGIVPAVLVQWHPLRAAHGLIVALPILTIFGIVNGVLRVRTDSIYPPMALHAVFNGLALIAAVGGV